MHTQNQFIAILLAISFQNVNSFCVWHIVFIIIWVLQFLFLIWVTLQNKKNPLQPVGVWYTVLAIPPQYFNSNPARSSDGEGVKCDSERQVPGEEKSKG